MRPDPQEGTSKRNFSSTSAQSQPTLATYFATRSRVPIETAERTGDSGASPVNSPPSASRLPTTTTTNQRPNRGAMPSSRTTHQPRRSARINAAQSSTPYPRTQRSRLPTATSVPSPPSPPRDAPGDRATLVCALPTATTTPPTSPPTQATRASATSRPQPSQSATLHPAQDDHRVIRARQPSHAPWIARRRELELRLAAPAPAPAAPPSPQPRVPAFRKNVRTHTKNTTYLPSLTKPKPS